MPDVKYRKCIQCGDRYPVFRDNKRGWRSWFWRRLNWNFGFCCSVRCMRIIQNIKLCR